ncbi:MAG: sialidase family protein, partial [Chitinophaga rupis]
MKIIYNLALLLLFQCFSSCDHSVKLPQSSPLADGEQNQKRDKTGAANIVFKSTDGGQTWQDISDGLPVSLKDDASGGRDVFFADDNGLWLTDGNGIYHSKPNFSAPFWNKEIFSDSLPRFIGELSSIAPGKAGIFAYNYHGSRIFQKTNGTGVWSPVFTNFPAKRVFSVSETAGGTIFIGSDKGLFKSTNSGKSWKQLNAPTGGKIVESNAVLLASCQGGIVRSTDDGESWALVISEGGVGIDVEQIEGGFAAIDYSTVAKTRRIRTSYDGGKTWQAIDAGFPGQHIIDAHSQPINTGNPAQVSNTDSAWHPEEDAPPVPEYKTSVVQVGENFFCGHTDGIYRSSD